MSTRIYLERLHLPELEGQEGEVVEREREGEGENEGSGTQYSGGPQAGQNH